MKKEFVMRGRTDSGKTETLNFSGYKPGYAYRLISIELYPMAPSGNETILASITAGKTAVDPDVINFNDEGIIATAIQSYSTAAVDGEIKHSIVNDTFLITQNLILMVTSMTSGEPVNWQCRFVSEKMNGPEESVANYKQFTISDG